MPHDTSRVEIMTWGTTPFDSKYVSPLLKELKGQNSGHGAFTLNLTNTEKHRDIYLALKAEGYPCAEISQPVSDMDENGKPIIKFDEQGAPVELAREIRYIIRFSPYWDFAGTQADQKRQRGEREFAMDQSRYWGFKGQDLSNDLPPEITQEFEGDKLLEIAKQSREQTKLYQHEAGRSGVTHILHNVQLNQEDLNSWNTRNTEVSNRLYETIGQPPDRIDCIPISNEDFDFGLNIDNLASEMLRIKKKANKKIYNFIRTNKDKENPGALESSVEIEKNILKTAYPNKELKHPFTPTFDELMEARNYLMSLSPKTEEQEQALNNFNELFTLYGQYASTKYSFIQEAISPFLFNCCATVKNCIRVALDPTYQGYLPEAFTIDTLTFPLELAQEAANLSDALYKDRINTAPGVNMPPITSRIKGFFLRAKNLNYTFLPSRTVIRPILMFGNAIFSPVVSVYSFFTKKVGEKENQEEKILFEKSVKNKRASDQHLIKKILEYKQGHTLFFIDNKTYNHIVKNLQSVEEHFSDAQQTLKKNLELYKMMLEKEPEKNADKLKVVNSKLKDVPFLEETLENIQWLEEGFKLFGGYKSDDLKSFQKNYNEILKAQSRFLNNQLRDHKQEPIILQYTVYRSNSLPQEEIKKEKKAKSKKPKPGSK